MRKHMQRGVWMAAVLGLSSAAALADDKGATQGKANEANKATKAETGATYENPDENLSHEQKMMAVTIGQSQEAVARLANQLALHDQQLIEISRMAETKATNPQVKAYARSLLEERERNLAEIEGWAGKRQIEIARIDGSPPSPAIGGSGVSPEMDAEIERGAAKGSDRAERKWIETRDKGQEVSRELSSLSGPEFDQRFIEAAKKGQEQARGLVRRHRDEDVIKADQAVTAFMVKTEKELDDSLHRLKQFGK